MKVPFCRPNIGEEEIAAVRDVLLSGNLACGEKVAEFEEKFAEYVGAKYAVATNSCTAALWMALKYNGVGQGVIVTVPSLTYTATASVPLELKAGIRFADVNKETFCLEGHFEKDTIAVHLTGVRSEAKGYYVVYDSAHRIERNDVRGSDSLWCYSFYATKNMTTGYGGMVATNRKDAYESFKLMQADGRRRIGYFYSVDMAVGGRDMNEIAAAIGLVQLKKLDAMNARRNEIVRRYNEHFGLARQGNHLYPILVESRPMFMTLMQAIGVQCSIHFLPLHKTPAYSKYFNQPLPNTEYLGERLVSLPLFPQMTNDEVDYVARQVKTTKLLIPE